MSARTPAKRAHSGSAAATPAHSHSSKKQQHTPHKAAQSAAASTPAKSARKSMPAPPPPAAAEEEADAAAEEAEEDEEFSEPEEVDNEQLLDEYARQQDGEEEEDDEDAEMMAEEEDDEDDAEEEADDSAAGAADAGSKKRLHAAVGQNIGGGSSGPKSKKAKSAAAIPTSDEVAALRQTEELFKSNLFKLQLEELLKELHVDYDKLSKLDPMLHALKANLESLPTAELSYDPVNPLFGAPLPQPVLSSVSAGSAPGAHHSFAFHAPTTFNLVGSYPLRTLLREHSSISSAAALNVDVCVEMPSACLKEKDYWDGRYLAKRARYLEHLAAHLMAQFDAQGGPFQIKLGKMRGAVEKPVLLLYPQKEVAAAIPATPAGKKGAAASAASGPHYQPFTGVLSRVVVRVFVSLPAGLFSAKRFHPAKSNLHARSGAAPVSTPKIKAETAAAASTADDRNDATGLPTPYYNHLLLDDMFYTEYLASLYSVFSSCPALKETLLLLKLWARQRMLDLARGARGVAATPAQGVNGGWGEFELRRAGAGAAAAANNKKTPKKEKPSAAAAASSSSSARVELVSPSLYALSTPCGGATGVSGFLFAQFLSHLFASKQLYKAMSTYQMFKIALQALVKTNWLASTVSGAGSEKEPGGLVHGFDAAKSSLHSLALLTNPLAAKAVPREIEALRSWAVAGGFEVLFLDASGSVNFASRMTKQTYLELKQEAFLSLAAMDDSQHIMQHIFGNGLMDNAATLAASGAAAAVLTTPMQELRTLLQTSKPLPSASSLGADSFQTLFMTRSDFHAKFDAFVRVRLGSDLARWKRAAAELLRTQGGSFLAGRPGLSADVDPLSHLVRLVSSVLELALGDRILLLHVQPLLLGGSAEASQHELVLEIGLLLNPFHSQRILDQGPSADDAVPAARFRALWGEMSTLRRFKDGSILEAVVWTTPGTAAGTQLPHSAPHLIPFQIISYILNRHFGVEHAAVSSIVNQLDGMLKLRSVDSQPTAAQLLRRVAEAPKPLLLSAPTVDPLLQHTSSLFGAFKNLSGAIKGLHAYIPLSIVNIRMTGEFSRYTSVFAAPKPVDITSLAPSTCAHALTDVVPVLLQFESSSKWPDDSVAISRIKSAFYIALGAALNTHKDIHSLVSLDRLHILYEGFVFELRIFYESELKIRQLEDKMGLGALGGPMIPVLSAREIHAQFHFLPMLGAQLKFVQETFPLFAPTCRLVKRWVCAHMLSPFFPLPEILELLVAPLFTSPKPYAVPGSALQAFHRWLRWLCSHDFAAEPVVVDLTGEMKRDTVEQIQARFAAKRAAGQGAHIYIATELDKESEMLWPRLPAPAAEAGTVAAVNAAQAPLGEETCMDAVILARVVAYARTSLAHLSSLLHCSSVAGGESGSAAATAHWKTLFKTPLDVPGTFDALIHLRADALPVQHLLKSVAPPAAILSSSASKAATAAAATVGHKDKKGYKLPPDAAVSASAVTLSDSSSSSSRALPLIAFSPLECLVASLRHMYGSLAYFFYDSAGGHVIGVRWRDDFRRRIESGETMKWSVKNSAHARPVHEEKKKQQFHIVGLALHLQEIFADMHAAGEGLIERIETAPSTDSK